MKNIFTLALFCLLTTMSYAQNELTKQDKKTIQALITCLKSADSDKLAQLIRYDFNNIEANGKKIKIKNKETFKKNFHKIFTKKRTVTIVNTKLSDWERIGSKGFTLQNENVTIWSDEDGSKIMSIFNPVD